MFPLRFRTAVNFQLWNSTEIILFWSHQTEELHWRVTASRRLRVTALRGEMIGLRCSKGLGWSRKSKRSRCSDFGSSSLSTDRIQFDWPCPNALHEWILPMTLLVFLVLFSLQLTVWLIYSCTEPEVIMSAIFKKNLWFLFIRLFLSLWVYCRISLGASVQGSPICGACKNDTKASQTPRLAYKLSPMHRWNHTCHRFGAFEPWLFTKCLGRCSRKGGQLSLALRKLWGERQVFCVGLEAKLKASSPSMIALGGSHLSAAKAAGVQLYPFFSSLLDKKNCRVHRDMWFPTQIHISLAVPCATYPSSKILANGCKRQISVLISSHVFKNCETHCKGYYWLSSSRDFEIPSPTSHVKENLWTCL